MARWIRRLVVLAAVVAAARAVVRSRRGDQFDPSRPSIGWAPPPW